MSFSIEISSSTNRLIGARTGCRVEEIEDRMKGLGIGRRIKCIRPSGHELMLIVPSFN